MERERAAAIRSGPAFAQRADRGTDGGGTGRGECSCAPFALAMEGERGDRARLSGEERPEMLEGVEERICEGGMWRRRSDGVEGGADSVDPETHAAEKGAEGFGRERDAELPGARGERGRGGLAKRTQKDGKPEGGDGVAGKDACEEDGGGAPAAAAVAALGAEDALAPEKAGAGIAGIVAPEEGVAVQEADPPAMRTLAGLEGKKGSSRQEGRETKRGSGVIGTAHNAGSRAHGETETTALRTAGLGSDGVGAWRGRTARLRRARPHRAPVVFAASTPPINTARKRCFLRRERRR